MKDGDQLLLVLLVVAGGVGVVCGFICSSIAKSKNRDPVSYFMLGLFLGVIGLIIAVVMTPTEPHAPPGMVPRTCPRCSARQNIPATATEFECWQCKYTETVTPFLSVEPGWYPDRGQKSQERYWDGKGWTDKTRLQS